MVSGGGWHATSGACALVEAALRAVSVVRGAGGDRAMSRAGPGDTGGGPPTGAGGLDDLAGAAPPRRDARRWPGLPGDGCAVARRTGRPPAEASETGDQRGAADICAGPAGRRGRYLRRGWRPRADRSLEGASARASEEPAVGQGVEPGADRPAVAARLSRRCSVSHQPPGHLPRIVREGPRRAAP